MNRIEQWWRMSKTRAGKNPAHRATPWETQPRTGPDDPVRRRSTCSCGWKGPFRTDHFAAIGDWESHVWEIANREAGK